MHASGETPGRPHQRPKLLTTGWLLQLWLVAAVALALPGWTHAAETVSLAQQREAAVLRARAGELDAAVADLEQLFADAPENDAESIRLRHDLGVVHAWRGDYVRAERLLALTPVARQPDYVLEAYADSLHHTGETERAVSAYRTLAARRPDSPKAALGAFYALMDAGRTNDAEEELKDVQSRLEDPAVAFAAAYLANAKNDHLAALRYFDSILETDPDNGQALRGKAMSALALGASWQALSLSRQHPGILSDDEHRRALLDTAAMQLRFGANAAENDSERVARAGDAISIQNQILDGRAIDELDVTDPIDRALIFDRIVALQQQFEMEACLSLYEATLKKLRGWQDFPPYALKAAGDAALYQQQPERAAVLYRQILTRQPDNFSVKMALFFALSDMGQNDEATSLLEQALVSEPAWRIPAAGVRLQNPDYAYAADLHAVSPAYVGDYDIALARLDELLALAPARSSARVSRAQVMRWRGWPRGAEREVDRVLGQSPRNLYARTTHAQLLMDVYRFEEADRAIDDLKQQSPYDSGVRSLMRRWQLHEQPELISRAYYGTSDGDVVGTDEWQLETLLYSAPIAQNYRLMVHDLYRTADFPEGTGRDHRLGVGVEYRTDGLRILSELSEGLAQNEKPGASLEAEWQIDDFWSLSGHVARNSTEVPLRGTRIGVRGDEAGIGGAYRWHEARRVDASASILDMNDGNLRTGLGMSLTQRLHNDDRQQLYGRLAAYASTNSEDDRVYFNPERDLTLTGALEHQWTLHRRYEKSLVQVLGIDGGTYWQSDYDWGLIWTVRFEHRWRLADDLELSYGASTGVRRYDGESEDTSSIYASMVARL